MYFIKLVLYTIIMKKSSNEARYLSALYNLQVLIANAPREVQKEARHNPRKEGHAAQRVVRLSM